MSRIVIGLGVIALLLSMVGYQRDAVSSDPKDFTCVNRGESIEECINVDVVCYVYKGMGTGKGLSCFKGEKR